MEEKKKKMSSLDATLMGIGEIIGAGIFSMTGVAIGVAGPGTPITYLLAGLCAMILCLPYMSISSAIPARGGQYLYVSRFIKPVMGFLLVWNMIFETLNLSVLGISTGQYLPVIFPFLTPRMAGIIVVILITIACLFNINTSAKVQNLMVVMILVTLGLYIFLGLPKMKYFTLRDLISVTGWTGIFTAVSYVRTAAYGAIGLVNMAGEIENARKVVPASIAKATLGCTALYALVALVSVGVVPWKDMIDQPLSTAAKTFMPGFAFSVFVICGALFGLLTTLLAMTINYSRVIWAAVDDGLLPGFLKPLNRHGIPYRIILIMGVVGVVPIILDLPLKQVFSIMNAPGMLIGLLGTLPALIAPKKLPNKFANAWFRVPLKVMWVVVIIHCSVTMFFSYTLFTNLTLPIIGGIIVFYGGGIVYYYIRKNYLKKKDGTDLDVILSTYDPEWLSDDQPVKID